MVYVVDSSCPCVCTAATVLGLWCRGLLCGSYRSFWQFAQWEWGTEQRTCHTISSTAVNSSSPAPSCLSASELRSSPICHHKSEQWDITRAHWAVTRRSPPSCLHSKRSFCWTILTFQLTGGNSVVVQQMVDCRKACIAPRLQYFHDKLSGEPNESVAAFKTARLVSPQKVVEI